MVHFNHFFREIHISLMHCLKTDRGKVCLKIITLWAIAFISYFVSIFFAINQEMIGVSISTILTLTLLVSTKWAKIED